MRLLAVLLCVGSISPLWGSAHDGPLKLGQKGESAPVLDESYFPPATEQYAPPAANEASPQMVESYRVETPATVEPPRYHVSEGPASHAQVPAQQFNQNSHVGGYTQNQLGGYPASREILEAAADKCDQELAILWQQQSNMSPHQRPHFQKCIGEAKVRCDALKKLVMAIKRADEQLFSYQQAVKNAQSAAAG